MKDEHGQCKSCGFDLNGDGVYEHFLKEYGSHQKALETAEMYGATKEKGRFGKAIHMKVYDKNYNKLPSWWMCPECRKECR